MKAERAAGGFLEERASFFVPQAIHGKMTIGELISKGREALRPCSATPALDAQVLLARLLKTDRAALMRDRDEEPSPGVMREFRALLERRKQHEPVHYILGEREFWSLPFKVTRGVFIPRPETELVVERALEVLRERRSSRAGGAIRVADLGTGCGNIAVALARELPGCVVHAVDISPRALRCARENAESNGVAHRVELHRGDLFDPLAAERRRLDMVVSNPPYVSAAEMEELPPEVRNYEPLRALDGGEGGLRCLRRIIDRSPEYLRPGGAVVLEMGMEQGEAVLRLMEERGAYRGCEVLKDYAGLDRVVSAHLSP